MSLIRDMQETKSDGCYTREKVVAVMEVNSFYM